MTQQPSKTLPPIKTSSASSSTKSSSTLNAKSSPRHVQFLPQPAQRSLQIPPFLAERNRFINSVITLIHCLQIPLESISPLFLEYKNEYVKYLISKHYAKSFIEQEINQCLIIIMRRLYFEK